MEEKETVEPNSMDTDEKDNSYEDAYEGDTYEEDSDDISLTNDIELLDSLEKIDWDQGFSVDIEEIDELQKKMFALLNVLIDLKDKNSGAKEASTMVAEITEYSRYFFSKEEEYLRKSKYPELELHSKEHRQFIKKTINLRREVAEDNNNLTYNVIKDLRDLLVDHLITSDLVYVPFLRISNYINECKAKK